MFDDPDRLDGIVAELRKYPGWPSDDVKDRAFAQEILSAFPMVDVEAEIQAWRIWMMDHEQKKQVRPRARFLRWLRGARGDFGGRSGATGPRTAQRRTSTVARSADDFGSESSRSLGRW